MAIIATTRHQVRGALPWSTPLPCDTNRVQSLFREPDLSASSAVEMVPEGEPRAIDDEHPLRPLALPRQANHLATIRGRSERSIKEGDGPIQLAALGVGWLLQRAFPLPFIAHDTPRVVGLPIVAIGLACALLTIITMMRGRGAVNTNAASNALVVTGIYRFSRNPMYVALAMMYTGFAVALGLPWGLVLLPLLLTYTQTMVVAREERFLSSAFGQPYTDYAAHVRRWL